MPLKITDYRDGNRIIGSDGGTVALPGGVNVHWSGDNTNQYEVSREGKSMGIGVMPLVETSTRIEYTDSIPPVDKGEPATEVRRTVRLERT